MPSFMRAVERRISAVSMSLSLRNPCLHGIEIGLVVVVVLHLEW